MMRRVKASQAWWVYLAWLLFSPATSAQPEIKLVVFDYAGEAFTEQEFRAFAQHLDKALPDHRVTLSVLKSDALREAVRTGQADILLVNPSLYEIIRHESLTAGVAATLERHRHGVNTSSLGGLIFTRADRPDIQQLADLANARIAIPTRQNTGAFRIPLHELVKAGLVPDKVSFLEFGDNVKVVEAVLSGEADVGFIRTGILEALVNKGLLARSEVKVIHARALGSYPFELSTELYPEWPLVLMPSVPSDVMKRLASAAYAFDPHPFNENGVREGETQAGMNLDDSGSQLHGFMPPLDYKPMSDLLREMRLFPYDYEAPPTLKSVWQNYWALIVLGGALTAVILVAFLVTEGLRRQLRLNHQQLKDVIAATGVGTWEWRLAEDRFDINAQYAHQIGYRLEQLQPLNSKRLRSLMHPEDHAGYDRAMDYHLKHPKQPFDVLFRLQHRDGHWVWIQLRGRVMALNSDGTAKLMDGTHTDITLQKEYELALKREAQYDNLTGLANRAFFGEQLLKQWQIGQQGAHTLSVLFLDLDGFKPINDQHGHAAGDAVLKVLAKRLTAAVKGRDTVGRIGGDEFVMALLDVPGHDRLEPILQRILNSVSKPIVYQGLSLQVTCSIGVFEYDVKPDASPEQAIQLADQAMYQAKQMGKNRVVFYDPESEPKPIPKPECPADESADSSASASASAEL
ncbi:MAG: diguanylate cyclase domain-containing protein [Hydrogenovibrio sp.]